MTADAARIAICDRIDALDRAQWTAVVEAAQAPAFYDFRFLRAYERQPLQLTEAIYYLTFGDPAVAVLPAYLQSTDDPLGVVASLGLPGRVPGDLILQTHVAHCYDTLLPARPGALTAGLVGSALETLRTLAAEAGAKWFAFLNVDGSGELAGLLVAAGLLKLPIFTRYNKHIGGYGSIDDFVAGIPSHKSRYALRRSYRQAERNEMRITRPDPAGGAPASVGLCRGTTARHGTAAYYPEWLEDFVADAAEVITVIEVRLAGKLASASICLKDPLRFHLWAAGLDYEVTTEIQSAFPLMLLSTVTEAIENRYSIYEAGRANGVVKERFRLEPRPLFAYVGTI
ncbi:MAG TPA: GNAT family N-acetyltransferase [Streptosporangiaceae bacterium]|nr:GNAT family N-acetyltransferase [Streptosporangiaceae bacterium]